MWALLLPFLKGTGLKLVEWICIAAVVVFLGYASYKVFHPKPTSTEVQKATTINNYNYNCKALVGWGCGACKEAKK